MQAPDKTLEVVILAAGRGTRMQSDRPKVLHCLGGRPMLAHVIETARNLGADGIHVIVGHGAAEVRDSVVADDLQFHLQPEQLGTGHAVLQALPSCHPESRVLVLFGDVPLLTMQTLAPMLVTNDGGVAVLTTRLPDPAGYGRVVRDATGRFMKIVEHKDASTDELGIDEVNTGVLAATAMDLKTWLEAIDNDNSQHEYYLPDVLALAVAEGKPVTTYEAQHSEETLGVNDRLQLANLERVFQLRQAESLLRAGVGLADPRRFDQRGELSCGSDVLIDVNVVVEGRVALGDGVRVGANSVLRDTTVGAGTQIEPFCHIEGARIGEHCRIGPYARLRPGTDLTAEVRIGNFVETKNARIGAGSKANHLAYIGDADVGEASNIGAGTITCNYDGANKHPTVLGNDVFIGSNSTLVAPITVHDGGFVAAGSTVTKTVLRDQLGVARAKQRNIDAWKRPVKSEEK